MVSEAEASEVWALFGKSSLFAKWPGVRRQLPYLLEARPFVEGGAVFEPGDLPIGLYLVVEGKVTEMVRYEKQTWLRMDYGPGQYFGQQALFTNQYRTRAVAQAGTSLYCMNSATLRVAMEQNSALSEEMLHEKRAARLRRILLLRHLPDEQIRQLASVIEEEDFPGGTTLPLQNKPGFWIVDSGQLRVTGPAARKSRYWPDWGITAGNFIVAAGGGLRAGESCTATGAVAHVKTHIFYLHATHAVGLLSAFPAVRATLRQPMDIVEALNGIALFGEPLEEEHREHLAQFCAWEFVPSGQNITTQGSVGHSFVILRNGAAVVIALDEAGRPRPRRYLKRGEFYGRTSLLQGKPREVTVRAKSSEEDSQSGPAGAEVIVLDRRDLQFAFAERTDLWHPGVVLFDETVKEKAEKKRFDWLEEGEIVRWADRPYILWLLLPELGVLGAALLALSLLRLMPYQLRASLATTYLVCVLPGVLLAAVWVLVNYLDDYYVVTNLRVTRRDRVWPFYESKLQAPIETVQQVTLDQGFFGRLLDYGHVSINTAAKVGALIFSHVPDPNDVQGYVMQGKAEAQLAGRGQQRESLRRGLAAELGLALLIPERVRALGDGAKPPAKRSFLEGALPSKSPGPELLPGTKRAKPDWFVGLAQRLPEKWQEVVIGPPRPAPQPLSGQVIWRKHWMNLIRRTIGPTLLLLFTLAMAWFGIQFLQSGVFGVTASTLALPWLFLLLCATGWWLYRYADWRNDIYVVTDDKLIDIEAKPLGLSIKRRETGLDRVQTVDYKQVGFIRYFLNYGDVVIRTAAADEGLDFLYVPNPRLVQAVVFQKLDAFRRKQDQSRLRDRQREMIESLEVYHEMRQER
jgi:CRP-like cAMP-binding protein/membrane protein YdbS with pleckstrin-like domain